LSQKFKNIYYHLHANTSGRTLSLKTHDT